MSSFEYNPSNNLAAGDSTATIVSKLHAKFLQAIRHIGADASETPSVTSDVDWRDLDPFALFRPEHFSNDMAASNFVDAGSAGRDLDAENFADGAFTTAKYGLVAERGLAHRDQDGHLRVPQMATTGLVVFRGSVSIQLAGTAPGPAASTGSATVNWTTGPSGSDELNTLGTVTSVGSNSIFPMPYPWVGRFTTSGGAEAEVKAMFDVESFTADGFTIYIVQNEFAGGVWTRANTEATTKTYTVPWYGLAVVS